MNNLCDYCQEEMTSPYSFHHSGEWYTCHKGCCAPMKRKLDQDEARRSLISQTSQAGKSHNVLGQTIENLRNVNDIPGTLNSYIRDFYEQEGLSKGTPLTGDIKSRLAKYLSDRIMNNHKER
jgi:hypothetical protein